VGDYVVAIGNPFGLDFTVTSGIISAKARILGAGPFDDFLQTDAAINPGNSGGPLFDLAGNVVGINTAIAASGQGIGFAVPIDLVKALLPQLTEKGRVVRGFLGLGIQDLTPELARALGLETQQGALVASVEEGGPAARAGVRLGDVVVSFEGQPVQSAAQLSRGVAMMQPGRRATLEVLRDGRRQQVTVELGKRPARQLPGQPQEQEAGALGLALEPVPPEVQRQLGIQGGARVAMVRPGSSAARAGLSPGDIIIEANRRPVQGPGDVVAQAKQSPREPLLLRVLSEGGARYVVVQPPRQR
jgi:serine protease Do